MSTSRTYICTACKTEVHVLEQAEHFMNVCDALVAKFDRLIKLEDDVKTNKVLSEMGADGGVRARGVKNLKTSKEALTSLFGSLSMAELAAFGKYRAQRV